jgi:hypothetical protein
MHSIEIFIWNCTEKYTIGIFFTISNPMNQTSYILEKYQKDLNPPIFLQNHIFNHVVNKKRMNV